MIGGGGCRIKYVMWMDGLLRGCVVCLAAVNTTAMNTRLYPSGHFRLPTTCSCQLIVSAVSTDTVFSVGRCSAKAAAAQYLDEDIRNLDATCSAGNCVDLSKLDPHHTFSSSGVPLSKES